MWENRPKSLCDKGLGLESRPPLDVNPYCITTYDNSEKILFFTGFPIDSEPINIVEKEITMLEMMMFTSAVLTILFSILIVFESGLWPNVSMVYPIIVLVH